MWMFDNTIIILAILASIFIPLLLLRYLLYHLKYGSKLTRYMLMALGGFGLGIIYTSFRIIHFQFFGPVDVLIDVFGFQISVFLSLLSMYAILRIFLVISKRSGHPIKRANYIRLLYMLFVIIFSTLNLIKYSRSDTTISEYYIYHVDPVLNLLVLAAYIPIMLFLIITAKNVLTQINNRKLIVQTLLLGFMLFVLVIERAYNLGYNYSKLFFTVTADVLLLDFIAITFLWIFGLTVVLVDPGFVETFNAHFALQSLYLMRKEGGEILYHHEFGESSVEADRFLLGGFVYAMSSGLKQLLAAKPSVETIELGSLTILFTHGNHVLGVLFVIENIPLLKTRLNTFLEQVEHLYERSGDETAEPLINQELFNDLIQENF